MGSVGRLRRDAQRLRVEDAELVRIFQCDPQVAVGPRRDRGGASGPREAGVGERDGVHGDGIGRRVDLADDPAVEVAEPEVAVGPGRDDPLARVDPGVPGRSGIR